MKFLNLDTIFYGIFLPGLTLLLMSVAGLNYSQFAHELLTGFLVTGIFYIFTIYLPRQKRIKLIRKNFKDQVDDFKRGVIEICIKCVEEGGINIQQQDSLMNPNTFYSYFKEASLIEGEINWDRVLNNLENNASLRKRLLYQFKLLREHIQYVLNQVQMEDGRAFGILSRLSDLIYELENDEHYDEVVRRFSSLVWELFTGWNLIDGYSDKYLLEHLVAEINAPAGL